MRSHPHPHFRKRLPAGRQGLEPYPSRNFWLYVLDKIVLFAGVAGIIMTIPQLATIYIGHTAAGVSAISWGAYAVLDIPWIVYGLVHREPPLTLTYVLWLLTNTLVCVGVLVY